MGRFLPDFGRVVAQTQLDLYHVYTVDEHSIRAIGVLAAIERGDYSDELPLASTPRSPSCGCATCSISRCCCTTWRRGGAAITRRSARTSRGEVATRLEFTPDEVETCAWLVRWHLLFSMTAFKRDPNDPRTVDDFVGRIRSLERLRLLLVLTAADITAVGPGRMTAWKASLLRMLYHRAEAVLAGGREAEDREQRVAKARQALRARLADWPEADIAYFEERLPVTYWLSTDSAMQERHARLVQGGGRGPLVETRTDRVRDATEMTLYTPRLHRPVRRHCRRDGGIGRERRRCPRLHHQRRDGGRHDLDSGRRRRRVPRRGPPGAAQATRGPGALGRRRSCPRRGRGGLRGRAQGGTLRPDRTRAPCPRR